MDKYEYKVHADEIKALVSEKKYADAMAVAESIDWTRVKSVMMLTIVSDIYKVNRKYEESKEVLLLAYERHPGGRTIVYSLCELSIKMEEFVQAIEYYKEYVQIAPKDTGRYILQYKLYEAQDVSLEERISVLEEFKRRDYREKWAYELAYLYHRIGLSTKCVEECDELILWFGEGRYVEKAMELKMLHEPLNPVQQEKYNRMNVNDSFEEELYYEEDVKEGENLSLVETPDHEMEIHVKTLDMGQYNTINLQKELADSMAELMLATEEAGLLDQIQTTVVAPLLQDTMEMVPIKKGMISTPVVSSQGGLFNDEEDLSDEDMSEEEDHTVEELAEIAEDMIEEDIKKAAPGSKNHADVDMKEIRMEEPSMLEESSNSEELSEMEETVSQVEDESGEEELEEFTPLSFKQALECDMEELARKKREFDELLAQEYDGQISLVVPEVEQIEKQITGQMNITDILAEWEAMKKNNQEKRQEEVRRRVSQQTGQLFSEFDEATKTDLLAKLEEASKVELARQDALLKEQEEKEDTLSESDELAEALAEQEEPVDGDITQEDSTLEEVQEAEEIVEESETVSNKIKAEQRTNIDSLMVEDRPLSEEEQELFGDFTSSKKTRRELLSALESITLAAYTGNILISGEPGTGTLTLAKNLIRNVQLTDRNFSGKVAKTTGDAFNGKNVKATLGKLDNGALIIEKANGLHGETLKKITRALEQAEKGIIIIMEDTPKEMDCLLRKEKNIKNSFNARIDVPQLDNDALVAYAKDYAKEQEYTIDDLGVLALYTRIAEMQTSEYVVSATDVEEIIEDAIHHANKKSIAHFTEILFAKRYDDEDMIILREKDFINY